MVYYYRFIRKGVAGGFNSEMAPEMIKRFDFWTQNELNKLNTTFTYNL